MQVEKNSVWEVVLLGGVEDGNYRVLGHYADVNLLVLFRLQDTSGLQRPIVVLQSQFMDKIKSGQIKQIEFQTPFYQVVAEEQVSEAHRKKRDERYNQIQQLVDSYAFLLEFALNPRSSLVAEHAKQKGTYVQSLYRSLNLYWKYGQERNALLPAYKYSGGAGKPRIAGERKRGSPVQVSTPGMDVPLGVNTSEGDKAKFLKAMKRYGLKGKEVTFRRVYDQMLKEFYGDELIASENEAREPSVPSYRAFVYWIKRLVPKQELIKRQTSLGDFIRNRRGLRGAATDHTEVPGSCFELDATVLDVHVVSEFNRNHVLGRPTVYCVVDKESRMIVGLHASMEYASWRAGRQALVNSFSAKKDYCAIYGIEIEEAEWPCHHIPQRLLCDRGEFICKDAEEHAVPLIGHLSIAPPYRAELKGIVEQRFNILNQQLVHELMGTTRGRSYIRGDKDPRLDAALTLNEITKLLIDAVLDHNSAIFESLAGQSTLLIESGLAPTPLNYWNIHVQRYRHALTKANEAEVYARLLPVETVTMTKKGIRRNDEMYFKSNHPNFEDWKVIARAGRSWPLEARFNQDNSSFIYVRLQDREGFRRCDLMQESANFRQRHQADIVFFEDWKKLEKTRAKPTAKSVERHKRRKSLVNNAKEEIKKAPTLSSKVERTRGMKERRREAIQQARGESELPVSESSLEIPSHVEQWTVERQQNVISLLKRKKVHKK
ncbi:transposase [Shewanella algae]|uniref:DDE-type integrase/transposase/recombinase n=1 Tax=Shewanella algae TaxID=38313 RepID=UPI00118204DA|nr:DDE-type integrase/transposase/recombinase [Shewanella algae]TVK96681.1 transposase [Shewanella algae]